MRPNTSDLLLVVSPHMGQGFVEGVTHTLMCIVLEQRSFRLTCLARSWFRGSGKFLGSTPEGPVSSLNMRADDVQ